MSSRKSLPTAKSANILDALRESMQTYLGLQGDKRDRGVTLGDLEQAGLIDISKTYLANGRGSPIGRVNTIIGVPGPGGTINISGDYEPDLTPPPTPTGFTVGAGISYLYIECAAQLYTMGHGHGVTNVYGVKMTEGAPAPTFADAVLLTTFSGTVHAHPSEPNTKWALWIKWVTKDGVESPEPAGGVNGLVATTGQDVRALLDALTAAAKDPLAPYSKVSFKAAQFYVSSDAVPDGDPVFIVTTTPVTINGVTVPPGTYMRDGFIQNGTITNAKIADATIDNAKIASVAVDKLTAGSLAVGSFMQSTAYIAGVQGWRINGSGNVELNNAIFRGSAFVGGSMGGIGVFPNFIQSTNYDGMGNGFRLAADGTLDLPGGSINAQHLNVGAGANLLQDSFWLDRTGMNNAVPVSWNVWSNESTWAIEQGYADWIPPGLGGVTLQTQLGPHTGGYIGLTARFPVIPGRRYEASIYSGAHRCRVYTDFEWYNQDGVVLSYSADAQVVNNAEMSGGKILSAHKRIGHFGIAPASAAYGVLRIIKESTLSGTNSYAFLTCPFVGEASARQTAFSPFSPTGIGTRVTHLGITTPSLQALSGVMGDLYAGSVRGGSFSGYAWPTNGGGGFFLGPSGLLLGNANAGRYFQVTEAGNMYLPGLRQEWGTLYLDQANVVNTLNVAGGAVASSYWSRGVNVCSVGINVPAGQVHRVALTASWMGRMTYWTDNPGFGIPGDVGYQYALTNVPNQFVPWQTWMKTKDPNGFNYMGAAIPPVSMTALIDLGQGYHTLTANSWGQGGVWGVDTEVTLVANVIRRP